MTGRMPGKVSTPKALSKKDKQKGFNRGTQDDLEVIGLILSEHAALRTVVFDRLRQAKARKAAREGGPSAGGPSAGGGKDEKAG